MLFFNVFCVGSVSKPCWRTAGSDGPDVIQDPPSDSDWVVFISLSCPLHLHASVMMTEVELNNQVNPSKLTRK